MLVSDFLKYINIRLIALKSRNAFYKKYKRTPKNKQSKAMKKEIKKIKYDRDNKRRSDNA